MPKQNLSPNLDPINFQYKFINLDFLNQKFVAELNCWWWVTWNFLIWASEGWSTWELLIFQSGCHRNLRMIPWNPNRTSWITREISDKSSWLAQISYSRCRKWLASSLGISKVLHNSVIINYNCRHSTRHEHFSFHLHFISLNLDRKIIAKILIQLKINFLGNLFKFMRHFYWIWF